jgi:hypothetical protein
MLSYHHQSTKQEILMTKKIKRCSVEGCDRPEFIGKHGLCRAHLQHYYRHGHPGDKLIRPKKKYEPYKENK